MAKSALRTSVGHLCVGWQNIYFSKIGGYTIIRGGMNDILQNGGGHNKRELVEKIGFSENTPLQLGTGEYLTFMDSEKCFDKLWLLDGIGDLWRCGTDVRTYIMIKVMNEKAKETVQSPAGETEPFELDNIVRQGTVYGPQICIASMDNINRSGKSYTLHPRKTDTSNNVCG